MILYMYLKKKLMKRQQKVCHMYFYQIKRKQEDVKVTRERKKKRYRSVIFIKEVTILKNGRSFINNIDYLRAKKIAYFKIR